VAAGILRELPDRKYADLGFHGARDVVIPVTASRKLIAAIRKVGGHPRYTEYRNVGHDVWKPALLNPNW